eukprot:13731386-Alexandrium_andersonii.AAC.1
MGLPIAWGCQFLADQLRPPLGLVVRRARPEATAAAASAAARRAPSNRVLGHHCWKPGAEEGPGRSALPKPRRL